MENKAHALAAGLFVLGVTALLVMLAVWLTREGGMRHVYELSTGTSVSGLQPQAPVRYRGVAVGKVTDIGFDPKAPGHVLVRVVVDAAAPITRSTFATLSYQGVTGLAFVQLDDDGESREALPANGEPPARIPLKPSLLGRLTEQGPAMLVQLEEASKRLNQALGDDNQKRLSSSLDQLAQAAGDVSQLALHLDATLSRRLEPALASLPALAADTGQTLRSLQRTADDIGQTARRLNEQGGALDQLVQGTGALAQAADSFGATTLPRVNRVSEDTSRAARQLSRTVNAINDNPQSLLFGHGAAPPGPGEPGFVAPGASR
ncbi:MAG: MlaD family protein [Burkholderiaceae bacterium]